MLRTSGHSYLSVDQWVSVDKLAVDWKVITDAAVDCLQCASVEARRGRLGEEMGDGDLGSVFESCVS